ncbi:hypothetical protein L6452_08088 [Arctium lappa]|uniref:Uncharacterized protein n=1 Tax=Arctium lappa TaxID=4217 RepID=A0ACB9DGB9_ARCLA|nr:hypothetical protein L6452_08088 [Arctium lappa]
MEIANAIADPVVKSLMDHVKKNIGYVISCTINVSEMKEKLVVLDHRKNDVQDFTVNFERNKLHIPSRVPSWLKEVEDIKAEVERFPRDVGSSNLKDKHRYGKKAFKIIERINRLIDDESSIKWTDHKFPVEVASMKASTSEPSLPRHDSKVPTPSCDDGDFQSRKRTFTEALEALESDDKSHMEDIDIPKEDLVRYKISLGCSLEEEEDRENWHSFENTLMLVTNKDQLLEFRINELFEKTEVVHLQVDDIRDGLMECFYPHQSSFNNLRVLKIVKCVDLRYLFSIRVANGLTKLERLTVSSCPILETLLDSENSGIKAIKFQALKFLSLGGLPKLMSFCNDVNAIELPQLEELILESLTNFTSMQPFLDKKIVITQLKKMKICKMENLKEIWPSNGGEVCFSLLKEIEVEGCESLVNLFPINPMSLLLHHLEEVKVTNCDSIDVLFNIDLGGVGEIEEGNRKLRSIKVGGLGNLREIWRVKGVNASNRWMMGFEALENIEILSCESLDGVFPPITANFDMRAIMKLKVSGIDGLVDMKLIICGQELQGHASFLIVK